MYPSKLNTAATFDGFNSIQPNKVFMALELVIHSPKTYDNLLLFEESVTLSALIEKYQAF